MYVREGGKEEKGREKFRGLQAFLPLMQFLSTYVSCAREVRFFHTSVLWLYYVYERMFSSCVVFLFSHFFFFSLLARLRKERDRQACFEVKNDLNKKKQEK